MCQREVSLCDDWLGKLQLLNLVLGIMLLTTDFGELTGAKGNTVPVMTIVWMNVLVIGMPFLQVALEMLVVQYRKRALRRKLNRDAESRKESSAADMSPQNDIFRRETSARGFEDSHAIQLKDKEEVRIQMAPAACLQEEEETSHAVMTPKASIMIIPPG